MIIKMKRVKHRRVIIKMKRKNVKYSQNSSRVFQIERERERGERAPQKEEEETNKKRV
tara:strand:+ start:3892 stop:4065 length:174 start_codon:yes stop_codon:yes gene_type:complete